MREEKESLPELCLLFQYKKLTNLPPPPKKKKKIGVKECTGNDRIAAYASRGVRCWSGNDDEAHAARHQGEGFSAAGVVSVASNLIPGAFARLMRERDDAAAAAMAPLIDWLFVEPNPIALNTALAMCGLCRPVFRLP